MRHRIGVASATGLGNPNQSLMDGKSTGNKKRDELIKACAKDAYKTFFHGTKLDFEYCDAQVSPNGLEIKVGIEPAYMHEDLKIIIICKRKEVSGFVTGYAWGFYGSEIVSKTKHYLEYKNKGKFVKFIDQWHDKIFKA